MRKLKLSAVCPTVRNAENAGAGPLKKAGVPEKSSAQRNCSVARTLAILSDAWTFLVIREAFFGIRRFQDFREELNIPRGTLSARLRLLTFSGILYRRQYEKFPQRFEYLLTEKGIALYPSFLALMSFGDRWLWGKRRPPVGLQHQACGRWITSKPTCFHCGEEVTPEQVDYHDGPGAGNSASPATRRVRRIADPDIFLHGRPCSVARTLRIIGDRWSFLVIREAFFAVTRYDEFSRNLQISTNILAHRLRAMLAEGIFYRASYHGHREQLEYRLTAKGKGLYPSMIAMMHWG
ncbi:MAG: helix-turn-helix transcriptional regulator, partial [Deltaproteobacteria bacterium]|nr:helix-turn-helix transcriptional regulator [Deltaproteobacteria bacterium]